MLIKIIMICLMTFELWYLQILYKNRYNQECKENEDFRDRAYKWSEKILKEHLELVEENQKLFEQNLFQDKLIDEMANAIVDEYLCYEPCPLEFKIDDCESKDSCTGCVKEYFIKKVEEQ